MKPDPLTALTPLKVLIVADKKLAANDDRLPYFEAIARAFQGGMTQSPDGLDRYYATGDDLGVDVRRLTFEALTDVAQPPDVQQLLQSCGHLLVVVFVEGAVAVDSRFAVWLSALGATALADECAGRVGILPIALDPQGELASLNDFSEFQRLPIGNLGEHALRPGHLGLLALKQAWSLLGTNSDEQLKLFISHAKRDSAPIARSLKAQIESFAWLQRFYDADDILPGTQWRRILQNGVKNSSLIILRTDIYEQRAWCVQEAEWAEEYGCPAVVVDARQSLAMPRELLPVTDLATLRVPDGNLLRILNAALREAVRLRLFRRTIELLEQAGSLSPEGTLIAPRVSLSALGIACESRLKTGRPVEAVVIPQPFREPLRPVAERLVQAYFPGAVLGVPRDFV